MGLGKKLKGYLMCGGITLVIISALEKCDDTNGRTSIERAASGALNGLHNCIEYSRDGLGWCDEKVKNGRDYFRGEYDK